MTGDSIKYEISSDGIDPVEYVKDYFTHLREKEIYVLVGSIALLEEVEIKLLQTVLDLEQIEVEEKIGRLMQTDLLDGKFTSTHFILDHFNHNLLSQNINLTLDDRAFLAYLKARFEVKIEELEKAFDISFASAIFILSGYIAKGLVYSQKISPNKFKFVTRLNYEQKGPDEISNFEKEVVGYFQLKGKTTIKEVAATLEEPDHKVLSTLTNLILSDVVLAKFSIQSGVFGKFTLEIEIDNFQVYFDPVSVQVMPNNLRNFIGYLSLRKSASLSEIAEVLDKSPVEILRIASNLHATNQFHLSFSNDTFSVKEPRPLKSTKDLDVLSKIHSFNYRIMIGLIQTQQKISVREIADKMDINPQEVIEALIICYLEGIIDGRLDNRQNFHLDALKLENKAKDVTLERWERILLGALISEQVIPWPKIAALLEVDRTTARNRAFEFISRGISSITAKDAVIALGNVPNLPPLVQISELKEVERQILGYILSMDEFSIKSLAGEFNLNSIVAFRYLYFLCGSGLFQCKRDGNEIKVITKSSIEPEKSLNELDIVKQQMIRAIEQHRNNSIELSSLRKNLELSSTILLLNLYEIIAMGYYSGEITKRYFIRKSSLNEIFQSGICLFCAKDLEPRATSCHHCGKEVPLCGVCRGQINSNDDLLACPHCKNLSHSNHIRQWLQIKNECPFCRNRISVGQLLVKQPLL